MNHPKYNVKLLNELERFLTEQEALELALKKNSQWKEIYTITQEIKPKIRILNKDQEIIFKQLLKEFTDLFAKDITQLGKTNLVTHKIYTEDILPISSWPYIVPLIEQIFINKKI